MCVVNDGQREPARPQLVLDRLDELGHRDARDDQRRDGGHRRLDGARSRGPSPPSSSPRLDPAELVDERRARAQPVGAEDARPRFSAVSAHTRSPTATPLAAGRAAGATRSKIAARRRSRSTTTSSPSGAVAEVERGEHARHDEDRLGAGPEERAGDPPVRVRATRRRSGSARSTPVRYSRSAEGARNSASTPGVVQPLGEPPTALGVVEHTPESSPRAAASLDLVEPGRMRRGEVEAPARVLFEPGLDLGCLVHLQVVEDRVHVFAGRDLGLELVQEVDELEAAVALVDVADDLAAVHEQRRQQRLHTVAFVFELAPGGLARLDGKLRPDRLLGLDRGLLVDRDDDRVLGRIQVQPAHVGLLGIELRIEAGQPRAHLLWLQVSLGKDLMRLSSSRSRPAQTAHEPTSSSRPPAAANTPS